MDCGKKEGVEEAIEGLGAARLALKMLRFMKNIYTNCETTKTPVLAKENISVSFV